MRRASRRVRSSACPRERGQATVEFALILPLAVFLLLAVLQTALVVRDYVGVVHAAREAVRAVSVDPDPGAARAAARRVMANATVKVGPRPPVGGSVRVDVTVVSHTDLALVGVVFPDPVVHGTATMRTER